MSPLVPAGPGGRRLARALKVELPSTETQAQAGPSAFKALSVPRITAHYSEAPRGGAEKEGCLRAVLKAGPWPHSVKGDTGAPDLQDAAPDTSSKARRPDEPGRPARHEVTRPGCTRRRMKTQRGLCSARRPRRRRARFGRGRSSGRSAQQRTRKKGPKVTMTHHDPTAMLPETELTYSYSRENQNSLSLVGTSVLP